MEEKEYLIVIYEGLDESLEFDILKTKHENDSQEFNDIMEEYQTNFNTTLAVPMTEQVIKTIMELAEKLKNHTRTGIVMFKDIADKSKNPHLSLSARDILNNPKIQKR